MNKNNAPQNKKLQSALVISLSTLSALIALLTPDWKQKLSAAYYVSADSTLQLGFNAVNSKIQSHREKNKDAQKQAQNIKVVLADLKYERVKMENVNGVSRGNIESFTIAANSRFSNFELGAYIPYDYMDFNGYTINILNSNGVANKIITPNNFTIHRTGLIAYAKHSQTLSDVSDYLQLNTSVNVSGIATHISNSGLMGMFGTGLAASLNYDDGGDFIPRALFSFQYSKKSKINGETENEQFLIKTGAFLGYRLFENGTLNGGFSYTRDLTSYKTPLRDNDYFDLDIGGSYFIADTWQVNLTYRTVLGMQAYTSNAVFLGTSLGF